MIPEIQKVTLGKRAADTELEQEGYLGPNSVKKDILSTLPRDVALLVLEYVSEQDLLASAFVSSTWNGLVCDARVWSCRKTVLMTQAQHAKMPVIMKELGKLLGPSFVPSTVFDPKNDNPFLNENLFGPGKSYPFEIKFIALTIAIRIVKKYDDYKAIDWLTRCPELTLRLLDRRLSHTFKIDFLQGDVIYWIERNNFEKAFLRYKNILTRNPAFVFKPENFQKMYPPTVKKFITWMLSECKHEEDKLFVNKIYAQIGIGSLTGMRFYQLPYPEIS